MADRSYMNYVVCWPDSMIRQWSEMAEKMERTGCDIIESERRAYDVLAAKLAEIQRTQKPTAKWWYDRGFRAPPRDPFADRPGIDTPEGMAHPAYCIVRYYNRNGIKVTSEYYSDMEFFPDPADMAEEGSKRVIRDEDGAVIYAYLYGGEAREAELREHAERTAVLVPPPPKGTIALPSSGSAKDANYGREHTIAEPKKSRRRKYRPHADNKSFNFKEDENE